MPRTLRFTQVEDGATATADLLEERAPKTCDAIWERLPIEGRLIHGMYSGPELFVVLDEGPATPPENQVHLPLPGDVGYFHHDSGLYAQAPHAVSELVFIYGRGVSIKGPEGVDHYVSLFAQLRLEESPAFLAACRRVRRQGPLTLRVERGDPA